MKFNKIALFAILAAQLGWAANPANLDAKAVEKIVHDYLVQNPGPADYYKEYVTINQSHKPSVKLGNKTKKYFFNEI